MMISLVYNKECIKLKYDANMFAVFISHSYACVSVRVRLACLDMHEFHVEILDSIESTIDRILTNFFFLVALGISHIYSKLFGAWCVDGVSDGLFAACHRR